MKMLALIETKTVETTGPYARASGKIAARFRFEVVETSCRSRLGIIFEDEIDALCLWRPDTKLRFVRRNEFSANRQAALRYKLPHALSSPIARSAVAATGEKSL